ncbi:hypothetical protein GCM10007216_37280 [Thalassobacillus devorans]|uniref:Uncharacterized protein n=1 Tax=Thalassobacillus devorans TaxID=279813 RepID=A0ABQ1PTK5_9BACI|nr:hypothetical protein [Thalassobacillus devorans]NIK30699.1 hypothetical protein [Thalassobacillus devorans]GGD03110.1 hypothetical protein GCM10007216_37280 [Thalassobacillus devorans]
MNVNVLGEDTLESHELPGYMYKNLKPSLKLNRQLNKELIEKGIVKKEKVYHPMWIVKMLEIADRKPFPPRKRPNMLFVDAVSGYRGLFPNVPPITQKEETSTRVKKASITKQELLGKYIVDVQEKQINRKYVLKKPGYEIKEIEMVYLPLWLVEVETAFFSKTFVLNGNTGESEDLLMKLWKSNEWKL